MDSIDLFCEIFYYEDEENYGLRESYQGGISPEFNKLLIKYYLDLGIDAFKAEIEYGNILNIHAIVRWRLQDKWYSTEEINRMMSLRLFL